MKNSKIKLTTKSINAAKKFMHELLIVSSACTLLSFGGEFMNTAPRLTVSAETDTPTVQEVTLEDASTVFPTEIATPIVTTIPVSEIGIVEGTGTSEDNLAQFTREVENRNLNSNSDAVYPATFKVYKLDYDEDLVYIISSTGYVYTFYGCEDYMMDDYVTCIMGDNSTSEITDDYIIEVRYAGFWDNRTDCN